MQIPSTFSEVTAGVPTTSPVEFVLDILKILHSYKEKICVSTFELRYMNNVQMSNCFLLYSPAIVEYP